MASRFKEKPKKPLKKKAQKSASTTATRWNSYAWLLLNTITWGAAFVVVKPALDTTTPVRFLLYRYILALILSLPILFFYIQKLSVKKIATMVPTVVKLEMIGTVLALSLVYFGLERITAIETSLLAATQPLFISLGGLLLLKETITKTEKLCMALAVLGTVLISLEFESAVSPIVPSVGVGLVSAYLLVNAYYFPVAKKSYKTYPKFLVTTLSYYVAVPAFLLLSVFQLGNLDAFFDAVQVDISDVNVWIASGYMALFGSIVGLTAYIKGQNGIEASEASLFQYLQPIVAVPLGIFLLGEGISLWQVFGIFLVICGVIWAERRNASEK